MNMRASELRKFSHLLLFPSIFCWYFRYFVSETYFHVSNYICIVFFLYNQCSFLSLLMVWYYLKDSMLTKHYSIEEIYTYASELRKVLHSHILKLLFLLIFCWYFRYFVGTNNILVGLFTCTDKFQMYRQNSEKALLGGGGQLLPLAMLVIWITGGWITEGQL